MHGHLTTIRSPDRESKRIKPVRQADISKYLDNSLSPASFMSYVSVGRPIYLREQWKGKDKMGKTKRATMLALAAVVMLIASAVPVSAHNGATKQTADLHPFPLAPAGYGLDADGENYRSANLVRTDGGISFRMRTDSLTPGDVVTVWYVIFNNPGNCSGADAESGPRCGLPDLGNDKVGLSIMWAAGSIGGRNGTANWAGHIREGQLNPPHPVFGVGDGLTDARGAEVHLIVHSHGPARPGDIGDQLRSFGTEPPDTLTDLQSVAFRGNG
jgi:hypothetical protein